MDQVTALSVCEGFDPPLRGGGGLLKESSGVGRVSMPSRYNPDPYVFRQKLIQMGWAETGGLMKYIVGRIDERTLMEIEFGAGIGRPISLRIDNCFIKTHKPVMDDARYRIFDTMKDYRNWCKENLPDWLGYGDGG